MACEWKAPWNNHGRSPVPKSYTVEYLAEFTREMPSSTLISVRTVAAAKRCVLDLLGAAAAGTGSHSAEALRQVMSRSFREGSASVWYGRESLQASAASVSNSAAASALDVDDGHRDAGGHPGSAVIPAAFAVAEETGASGEDFLAAVVVGYEVSVRIAAARDFASLDTLSTGRWAAYGVAATACRLLGLTASQTADALAVSGVLSPGLSAAGYSALMGNHVKEGIPWSVLTGLLSVNLAMEGFSGPTDILDHPAYYDAQRIRKDLGKTFAIERTYFKPYSCCRWIHSALDALMKLMEDHHLSAENIEQVHVHTFSRALKLNNYTAPPTLESAQYSLPFCLAVAAVRGKEALMPLDAKLLKDPRVTEWAARVILYKDDTLDALFPARTAARVCLTTPSGTLEKTVLDPLGDPANPMTDELLESKFRHLSRHKLSVRDQDRLLNLVHTLEHLPSLSPLTEVLSRKAPPV